MYLLTIYLFLFFLTGKKGGKIEREFATIPEGVFYSIQDKAWMDKHCMMEWIEVVLKPYAEQAGSDTTPILVLVSYCCHLMGSVVGKIQELGIEVWHIPGGCTGNLQPIDVGINKPFKNRVSKLWEEWMVEQCSTIGVGSIKKPDRQRISRWIIDAVQDIAQTDIPVNAWRKTGFDWFA